MTKLIQMKYYSRLIISIFLLLISSLLNSEEIQQQQPPNWLINSPPDFQPHIQRGVLLDVRSDPNNMTMYAETSDYWLLRTDAFTDGEVVDALEHFFWGMRNGLAMELGALDGSPNTKSMTHEYERVFGWKRILIEGNPHYRESLLERSPLAFSANVAICEKHATVHFSPAEYVGGIVEFMSQAFLKEYHNPIYNLGTPPGNISSIKWDTYPNAKEIECIPLTKVLHHAHSPHINYFILDVEGGELEVLKSISWDHIRFDVLCVETDPPNRREGYSKMVIDYLASKGYNDATGQVGRNICK